MERRTPPRSGTAFDTIGAAREASGRDKRGYALANEYDCLLAGSLFRCWKLRAKRYVVPMLWGRCSNGSAYTRRHRKHMEPAKPPLSFDPEERAREKQASRDADERALAAGESAEAIDARNAFLTADRTIIHWNRSRPL
jgi:hypothetical protein